VAVATLRTDRQFSQLSRPAAKVAGMPPSATTFPGCLSTRCFVGLDVSSEEVVATQDAATVRNGLAVVQILR
jgi:hypothetical protein